MDEEAPWPRILSTNGNKVTLHLPQVERWTSNSFVARAPVQVKLRDKDQDRALRSSLVSSARNGGPLQSGGHVLHSIEITEGSVS